MRHFKTYIFFVLLFFFSTAAQGKNLDKQLPSLDALIKKMLQDWGVPGVAVGIVQNGEIKLMRGYGVTDFASQTPVTVDTVFQVASVSKTFTSTAMLLQSSQKNYSLGTSITKLLPHVQLGSPEHTQKITLRNILSHTTGFVGHAGDRMIESGESYSSILAKIRTLPIKSDPGKIYAYQNVIYSIAGDVIERRSRVPFAKSIEELILLPLEMHQTTLGLEPLMREKNKAVPHVNRGRTSTPTSYSTRYYQCLPAAGVNSSIGDMTKYLAFHMYGKNGVATFSTLKKLHEKIIPTPGETRRMNFYGDRIRGTWYGLGFRIYDWAGHEVITHAGLLKGFKSTLAFIPEVDAGIVILTHNTSPIAGLLRAHFLDSALGLEPFDWNQKALDAQIKAENTPPRPKKSKKRRKR